jgi:nucleoside-diphosphate-sugar epimerase
MLSKICGEVMVRHSGVPFTIIRPHNFYGPRMGLSHVIPELLQRAHAARDGDVLTVYSVHHKRTFCFIDDAVAMMMAVALSNAGRDEVFNVGSQSPEVSILELAEIITEVVDKRLDIQAGPETPGSPSRRCPEMSRLKAAVGLEASVSLREGVARCWDWYRDHVFDGTTPSAR